MPGNNSSTNDRPGGFRGASGSAVATALGEVLQQHAADLEPHDAGEPAAASGEGQAVVAPEDGAVAPGEAAAGAAAARAGRGLMIQQDRTQRVDRPSVVARPLQLGEFVPYRVDEPALVGALGQPFHGPGRQVGDMIADLVSEFCISLRA